MIVAKLSTDQIVQVLSEPRKVRFADGLWGSRLRPIDDRATQDRPPVGACHGCRLANGNLLTKLKLEALFVFQRELSKNVL